MKVGVIGTGNMGRNHVRVYSELRGVEEVYVYDADKEKTKLGYDVIVCDTMDKLLDNVDAVSICVPTKHHFEVAKKAIEKEVHCLIEKPITLTVNEGKKLLKLLENKRLTVGVGHIERFNPVVKEIAKIVEDPIYVEIKRHNPSSDRITDSTVVEDLMIHDIDILFNVLYRGKERYEIHSVGNKDVCTALIKFDSGLPALISASRKAAKKIRTIYVEEDSFTVEGNLMNQEIYIYKKPEKYGVEDERYVQENLIEKVLVSKLEPLKEELKTFIEYVKRGKDFTVTPKQGLKNLMICEEIKNVLL